MIALAALIFAAAPPDTPAPSAGEGRAGPAAPANMLSPAEIAALETKNAAEIAALQERAAKLPADDLEANRETYERLAALAPENRSFRRKLASYKDRIVARALYLEHPEHALSLRRMEWSAAALGSPMIIGSVTIRNDAPFDIKDLELRCRHFSSSGREVASTTQMIFEVVPANGSKTLRQLNAGLIASPVESTRCDVTAAKAA